jgi:hypothetical protein
MSFGERVLPAAALGHGSGLMKETESAEIRLPQHCGILVQLGLSMLETSNASRWKIFRLFLTYRLPACAYDLLTSLLFNKIPGYDD